MKRGSVSGPSHHVDNPVLRELTQIAMNEATANSHVNNKNRPQASVSRPARIAGRGPGMKAAEVVSGGGGGGIANDEANGGATEDANWDANWDEGAIGSMRL